MLLVDIFIVQVALPTIHRRLGGGFTDLQWVIDAYALGLAALILTFGSLADRFGRKTVFVTGLGVFTSASVLCGVADSTGLLIAARTVQGIGGAAMFATGLALIGQEFEGPSVARDRRVGRDRRVRRRAGGAGRRRADRYASAGAGSSSSTRPSGGHDPRGDRRSSTSAIPTPGGSTFPG